MAVEAPLPFAAAPEAARKRTRAHSTPHCRRERSQRLGATVDATFAHERLSAAVPQLQQQQRLKELAAEKKTLAAGPQTRRRKRSATSSPAYIRPSLISSRS